MQTIISSFNSALSSHHEVTLLISLNEQFALSRGLTLLPPVCKSNDNILELTMQSARRKGVVCER